MKEYGAVFFIHKYLTSARHKNRTDMKLKEINAEERPRERLLSKGAQALGNTELLAILLRTGNRGKECPGDKHRPAVRCGKTYGTRINVT